MLSESDDESEDGKGGKMDVDSVSEGSGSEFAPADAASSSDSDEVCEGCTVQSVWAWSMQQVTGKHTGWCSNSTLVPQSMAEAEDDDASLEASEDEGGKPRKATKAASKRRRARLHQLVP